MKKFVILLMLFLSAVAESKEEKIFLKGVNGGDISIKGIHNLNRIVFSLRADNVTLSSYIKSWYIHIYNRDVSNDLMLIIDDKSSGGKFNLQLGEIVLLDAIEHKDSVYKVTCTYSKGLAKYIIEDKKNVAPKNKAVLASVKKVLMPKLFTSDKVSSEMLAKAVNYYISLGEKKTLSELNEVSDIDQKKNEGKISDIFLYERVSWVCRILYTPKKGGEINIPFGYNRVSLPVSHKRLESLPLFPLAEKNGVYIVAAPVGIWTGSSPIIANYLNHCVKNGAFRKKKIIVPNDKVALAAFEDFQKEFEIKDPDDAELNKHKEKYFFDRIKLQVLGK